MSQRYSDIMKAARQLPYLENYIKWMTSAETRQPNVGKGKPKKASQKLVIVPFNVRLPAGEHAIDSGAFDTWEKYRAELGGHAVELTTANSATTIDLDHYKAARVIIVSGRRPPGEPPTVKTSHITGRKYTSRGGTSTSLPFGKVAADDTEAAVFTAISTAIRTASTTGIEITLQPEKFRAISAA